VDAKKSKFGFAEAKQLLAGIEEIHAAKGKNVVVVDLRKGMPSDEDLKAVLLGPTGNLRAPVLKIGKKLVVGFQDEMYSKILS
jgi:arsenate reductase-like glutaredoxin family protein